MNDTPTPRTDASEIIWIHPSNLLGWPNGRKTGLVPKDKMQQLETELTAVTEQRDRLAEELKDYLSAFGLALKDYMVEQQVSKHIGELTEQRDEARADAEKAKAYKKVLKTTNANLKRERDEAVNNYETAQLLSVRVGEQRDMLAEEVGQLKSRLTQTMGAVTISRNGYVQELEQERDRLAAVLQRIRDGYGGQVASPNCCEDCDYLLPIDEALQSLTPNAKLSHEEGGKEQQ